MTIRGPREVKTTAFAMFFAVAVAGCSTAPEEPSVRPSQSTQAQSLSSSSPSVAASSADAPGFYHSLNASRFRIGQVQSTVVEDGREKTIGSLGVFGQSLADGSIRAVPNAGATTFVALTSDPQVHNNTVRDYFVAAGLPSVQIRGMIPMATMGSGGPSGRTPADVAADRTFVSYTTRLSRSVSAIPVPDSFAWARFDVRGDVDEEAVHWPLIPGAVIDDALQLQGIMADPVQGARLRSMIPSGFSEVVIRHSAAGYAGPSQVFACVDVQDTSGLRSSHETLRRERERTHTRILGRRTSCFESG